MLRKLSLLSVTLGLVAAQAAIIDNFDRADASTLGPNWTVISGGGQITGNRAAGLSNGSLLTYNGLSSPFSSARIIVTVSGLTANLDIDTDFDGTPDQSYSYNYATATGGTGVGLGFYGAAQADNFSTDVLPAQVPEPGTLVLTLAGLAAAGLLRKRAAR